MKNYKRTNECLIKYHLFRKHMKTKGMGFKKEVYFMLNTFLVSKLDDIIERAKRNKNKKILKKHF